MPHISVKSPSKNKAIELTFDRELHFGPLLFKPKLIGFDISSPLGYITDNICWSNNEQYIAVVEVEYIPEKDRNISKLKVINTKTGNINIIDSREALLIPKSISNSGLVKY